MGKGKKVYRITEVHEEDACFPVREQFLGRLVQPMGTLKIRGDESANKNLIGYAYGYFTLEDSGPDSCFYAIKLKQVFEEENKNEQS